MTSRIVVDARADKVGNISHVLFKGNERFTRVDKAVALAKKGEVGNAHAVCPKQKKSHLRMNPNSLLKDNLDEMAGDKKQPVRKRKR